MTEHDVLLILRRRLIGRGKLVEREDRGTMDLLRRIAREIGGVAEADQRRAARTASMIGALVTRGRTRL